MFVQGSLLGGVQPAIDAGFADARRVVLDACCWVEHAPEWLAGSDLLLDELLVGLPWRQRTGVVMYDRVVDEPRLSAWWCADDGLPEPAPILAAIRAALVARYAEAFDSIGFNLYRTGNDSVAWHADRHARGAVDLVVAIVSLGARRPFRMRRRGGGRSLVWQLGAGDLFVMGGSCQHHWEHVVPKLRRHVGARLSVTFRHGRDEPSSASAAMALPRAPAMSRSATGSTSAS